MGVPELAHQFVGSHPNEAALILEGLAEAEVAAFLANADPGIGSRVVGSMAPVSAVGCMRALGPEAAGEIVARLDLETGATLLRMMPAEDQRPLLRLLPEERRESLQTVLQYPEHTAGSLMDPNALVLPGDISLQDGLNRVRRHPERASYYLYVIDRSRLLIGVMNIRELMIGDPEQLLSHVMRPGSARLNVNDHLTRVLAHPGWLEFQVLPVLDDTGRFVGALRHRTLRRLQRDAIGVNPHSASAGSALGELYQIGLAGLAQIAAPGLSPAEKGKDL